MKQFGQYDLEVRHKAIDNLADRGIHVWDADFDQNSEVVLEECRAVEEGRTIKRTKPEAMYTWTPEMRAAYHNSPDGIPGKCLALSWAAAQSHRDEGQWAFERGETLEAGMWTTTVTASLADREHCRAMNRLHAEGYNDAARKVGRKVH